MNKGIMFQNPLLWKPGDKTWPSLEENWEIKLGPLSRKLGDKTWPSLEESCEIKLGPLLRNAGR
jgi:hypothetical protein